MQVKGTSIKTTRDFVKTKFKGQYDKWLNTLSQESQKLYKNSVDITQWYDLKTAYTDPLNKIVELFYNKDYEKGGAEIGKYSAEVGLKGVYKVFLMVATPQFLMKRASRAMETFYQPSEIEVTDKAPNEKIVTIKKFDGLTLALEYRIAGWIEKALEMCKCKAIQYEFTSNISKGQNNTTIIFKWAS